MSTALRETVYKLISDAFYEACNASRTMTDATNAATDAVLAALAPPTVEQIAEVVTTHSYDYEAGECMCGHRGADLAAHLAQQIVALHPGPTRAEVENAAKAAVLTEVLDGTRFPSSWLLFGPTEAHPAGVTVPAYLRDVADRYREQAAAERVQA